MREVDDELADGALELVGVLLEPFFEAFLVEDVLALTDLLYFLIVLIPHRRLELLLTRKRLHANAAEVVLGFLGRVKVFLIVYICGFTLKQLLEVLVAQLLVDTLLVILEVVGVVLLDLHVVVDLLQHLLVPLSL